MCLFVWAFFLLCLFSSSSSEYWRSSGNTLVSTLDKHSKVSNKSLYRLRRDLDGSTDVVRIDKFHVTSRLYFRFAKVTIESEVVNAAREGQSLDTTFRVQLPESAFMSNFTMEVDGILHVAKVMERGLAQKQFDEARAQNKTAGQVKQVARAPERGMDIFSIDVNLSPRAVAYFTLTYYELLDRRLGTYSQRLFLEPGGVVTDLKVEAFFSEDQGFESFVYKLPGDQKEYSSGSDKVAMEASVNTRTLTYSPSVAEQRAFNTKTGISGEFVVTYDVCRRNDGGFVVVQDSFFTHFVAPRGLPALPKNILFIIDISGSMSGAKIEKARDAMLNILDSLAARGLDVFNVFVFDNMVEGWRDDPAPAVRSEVDSAKLYVADKLQARGSTNIYDALMRGLAVLLGDRAQRSCDKADMIIFLTDGDPTAGVVNTDTIISDFTTKNNGRAAVFSLGFGFDMNFQFLAALSENNAGFARRIYDDNDANFQLKTFYDEISSPVGCDLQVFYNSDLVDVHSVTDTRETLHFDGKEFVVVGETKMAASELVAADFGARLQSTGANGSFQLVVPPSSVKVIDQADAGGEAGLTEKLYVYQKIKQLLARLLRVSSESEKTRMRQEALDLSLKYGFVTPLTSFSVVVEPANRDSLSGSSGILPKGAGGFDLNAVHAAASTMTRKSSLLVFVGVVLFSWKLVTKE